MLSKSFIEELKLDGTYNDASFAREYESEWSGDAENAFFSSEKFDKHRVLLQPEYEWSGRSSKSAYYVLGVDVGRKGCTTEVCVIKVTPQAQGAALKTLVNIYFCKSLYFTSFTSQLPIKSAIFNATFFNSSPSPKPVYGK